MLGPEVYLLKAHLGFLGKPRELEAPYVGLDTDYFEIMPMWP